MSHRKFEAPRHGSLGFLPRKRANNPRGAIKSFPKDDQSKPCHLTAFMGYKAGMTLIVRELDKVGSKMHKKEVLEAVTIVETPPMIVVGVVGYMETPRGLRQYATVWAQHISSGVKRKFTTKWYRSAKLMFKHNEQLYAPGRDDIKRKLGRLMKYSSVVRVLAHTQIHKINGLHTKKVHLAEIQVNGGTTRQKVEFANKLFEKEVPVSGIFSDNEMIDVVSVTKGKGFNGVVARWGVRKLPRKTHKGLRKVACIGAWHPSRVSWAVPRAGQLGFHHRTDKNIKIYRVGKSCKRQGAKDALGNASTEFDLTEKNITPMGGFPNYGVVREDFLILKGTIPGSRKRVVTLRKSLFAPTTRNALEKVVLKFIDTATQFGHGRFQTSDEKRKFNGPMKPRPGPPPGSAAYQAQQERKAKAPAAKAPAAAASPAVAKDKKKEAPAAKTAVAK